MLTNQRTLLSKTLSYFTYHKMGSVQTPASDSIQAQVLYGPKDLRLVRMEDFESS